jgi:hypothetical protein
MSDDETFYSANNDSAAFLSLSSLDTSHSLGTLVSREFLNSSYFNVCHINAQSIPSHFTDLLDTFQSEFVHAILVSESWLKPTLASTSYALPGFVLIRNDRTGKGGGGVAIYLRSSIPYKILNLSQSLYSGSAEWLFLELNVKGAKAVLGVVYCPPTINYFSDLEQVLESLSSDYTHHLIMGDLNTDLCKDSPQSRKLTSLVQSVNFSILPLDPTHHTATSDTWLDVILTSFPNNVIKHGQFPAPGFSHHDLVFASYKIKPAKYKPAIVVMRSFAKIDSNLLLRDAAAIDWSPVFSASSTETKVTLFNAAILKLFDKHAPLHKVKVKRPPAPWITEGVRMAMRRRNRAFKLFKRDRSDENWRLFKRARNRCNQMVRIAKRRFIHQNVSSSSMADVWKFLKSLGLGKTSSPFDGTSFSLQDLNSHFSSARCVDNNVRINTLNEISSLPLSITDPFSFSFTSQADVKAIIIAIQSKAIGCDDIGRYMIVSVLDCVLPVLTDIINASFFNGEFPSLWRKAFVIPLPKISNPTVLSNFRPISILPFLSKVAEAVAHKQLSHFIFSHNLLSPYQSGFRPCHSTSTALLKVTEDIRRGMESQLVTVLILIDFSNAFNTVDHEILLALLEHLNVSSLALRWFSAYLQGRQQAVRVDRALSDWCDLATGVPQGGILSPLLFSIFINFITPELRCSYHLYADDLQLYDHCNVSDLSVIINKLNLDLLHIQRWSEKFGLFVNPSKCQAIVIGSPQQLGKLNFNSIPAVEFNGTPIPYSKSVKDLGVYLDNTLSWRPQISEVSRKVVGSLHALNRLKHFLPIKTKILLVQTLILPIIDYGDVCYPDLNGELLDKLDRLLNNCIRFIFCLRKYDHVSSFRSQLGWLPIRLRRKIRLLCTLFSILNDPKSPEYLKTLFHYYCVSRVRQLRSSGNLSLSIPPHRTGFMSNSFSVQVARLWNSLPVKIRQSPNRLVFKKSLQNFFAGRTKKSDL